VSLAVASGGGKEVAALLVEILRTSPRARVDCVGLSVLKSNAAAINLYRKLGFHVSGDGDESGVFDQARRAD
jgi:ribosomal protein S18 acetylase RimI-like enzyme